MTQGYYNSIMSKKGVENIMPKILREKSIGIPPPSTKEQLGKYLAGNRLILST